MTWAGSDVAAVEPGTGRWMEAWAPERSGARRVAMIALIVDAVSLMCAFVVMRLAFEAGRLHHPLRAIDLAAFALTLPLWAVIGSMYRIHDRENLYGDRAIVDDLAPTANALLVGGAVVFGLGFLVGGYVPSFRQSLVFIAVSLLLMLPARAIVRTLSHRRTVPQNAVIVGAGAAGHLVGEKLVRRPDFGIRLVGFVDDDPLDLPAELAHVPVLGRTDELPEILAENNVGRVIIAYTRDDHDRVALVRDLVPVGYQVDIVPRLFEAVGPTSRLYMLEGLALVGLRPPPASRPSMLAKRIVDVILASCALVVLSPYLLYCAIRIKLDSPGPVLHRSHRLGRFGKPIKVFKFRTMDASVTLEQVLESDPALRAEFDTTFKLREDPRVTRFGAFLRRTSMDELPQLLNVLRGDISLVGPRPIVEEELRFFGRDAATLLSVPPGMTGFWQINGRSDVSYPERVRLELAYVQSHCLSLDMTIMARTARALLTSRGAY
ncbi:MAG: sugar transferase [Gaiellales bacterium]